ncbi:putative membrane protein YeiB [Pseudonocardia cypriaca]|uniref:Putative membrane protein YeiB n=2 Tax=Pseudonocardia cypriaca TaxID=882449 RepID=A0A543GCM3_9PSEU|nr:putative membrane protein YeiB [Pseudonocardia cypriaca]
MMATHAFGTLADDGAPTVAQFVAGGRAATTFVLVAGVSLAFLSGGSKGVRGRERVAAAAGLAARAALVGAIGLGLGYLAPLNGIDGILPFYGLFFLLAIPLLWCTPLVLIFVAALATAVGPVLVVTALASRPDFDSAVDPTFGTLFQDPLGLLDQLFLTGEYPALVYLAYLCIGLAIGRLDLRSRGLAWWLLAGGLALAATARAVSDILLYRMGGLDRLIEATGLRDDPGAVTALLWEPEQPTSPWYLALPTPHSHTPVDVLHTAGSAAAVLGAALLLTRIPAVARALAPIAAAGSMSLTMYSAHLILLATGFLGDDPVLLFLAMVVGALALAAAWRSRFKQGPLEALVADSATAVRRMAARDAASGAASRTTAKILRSVVCVAVLALTCWAGAAYATPLDDESADIAGSAASEDDAKGPDEPDTQTPPLVSAPEPAQEPASPPAVEPAASADRYCELADQLYTLDDAHPDQPELVAEKGASALSELPQAAPAQIRDAVTTLVADYRAAGVPGVTAPNGSTLSQAEATVDAFEDENC